MERQSLNVFRMRLLGAEVREVTSGTSTLKDACSAAIRDWVTNVEDTHYILGSVAGPHPFPTIVSTFFILLIFFFHIIIPPHRTHFVCKLQTHILRSKTDNLISRQSWKWSVLSEGVRCLIVSLKTLWQSSATLSQDIGLFFSMELEFNNNTEEIPANNELYTLCVIRLTLYPSEKTQEL